MNKYTFFEKFSISTAFCAITGLFYGGAHGIYEEEIRIKNIKENIIRGFYDGEIRINTNYPYLETNYFLSMWNDSIDYGFKGMCIPALTLTTPLWGPVWLRSYYQNKEIQRIKNEYK